MADLAADLGAMACGRAILAGPVSRACMGLPTRAGRRVRGLLPNASDHLSSLFLFLVPVPARPESSTTEVLLNGLIKLEEVLLGIDINSLKCRIGLLELAPGLFLRLDDFIEIPCGSSNDAADAPPLHRVSMTTRMLANRTAN